MPISPDDFKSTMRQFSAGVTIVTAKAGEDVHGMTVSAFVSVSAEPPLISVIINNKASAHKLLQQEDAVFAVNILKDDQQELSNNFAWGEGDRFAMGNWTTGLTGAPVLADALAWLDCTIYDRYVAGSHTIYIGEVQATNVLTTDESPLIYWNRDYRTVANLPVLAGS
ncbi:MAG: flavin reductase family protein [Chloroflexota bacterium]